MKKWLVTCLLAIALLFVATTAMAAHIRLNGDYCEGNTFEIRKREGENAVFTLDFTDAEIPTVLIRLIPTAE